MPLVASCTLKTYWKRVNEGRGVALWVRYYSRINWVLCSNFTFSGSTFTLCKHHKKYRIVFPIFVASHWLLWTRERKWKKLSTHIINRISTRFHQISLNALSGLLFRFAYPEFFFSKPSMMMMMMMMMMIMIGLIW